MKFTGESHSFGKAFLALLSHSMTSCSGRWKGNGRSSRVSTMLKMAVAAPAPRPSVTIAIVANDGARRHWRHATLRSPANPVNPPLVLLSTTGRDSGGRVRDRGTALSGD